MFNFKELVAGIVLIFVLGIIGFLYRNAMESSPAGPGTACTAETKVCPDGTVVTRIGPACVFAPCPTATSTAATAPVATSTSATSTATTTAL